MSLIRLEKVRKHFSDGTVAVDDVSLTVEDREFLVLVGPSGCGKSTTLRMIAGLETVTDGTIQIGGQIVNDVAPKDRDIAMVFQNYALYPHMSVYNNLSFGLRLRYGGGFFARVVRRLLKPGRHAELEKLRLGIDQQVRQTASRLGIEHLLNRKPYQLSGGERQRVALGRAIVRNPAAFLFDEPLSNLDAKLRGQLRVELKRLHRQLGATMIYVTHDQIEAMTLGDRVAVMNGGKILQIGPPLQLYQQPADLFVARFIGSTPLNLCYGQLDFNNGRTRFVSENIELRFDIQPRINKQVSKAVVGFRSEDVSLSADETKSHGSGEVLAVDRLGESTQVHILPVGPLAKSEVAQTKMSEFLIVKTNQDSEISPGQRMQFEVNTDKILWFDAENGKNLLRD